MRAIGLILMIVGLVALAVPSFTFFTQERVAETSFFHIDVNKPHTVILNPGVGIAAIAVGAVVLLAGRKSSL